MNRREFLGAGAGLAMGAALARTGAAREKTVRVGVIGTGNRGRAHVAELLRMPGVEVPAVCDVIPEAAEAARELARKAGRPEPEAHTNGELDYRRLVERDDLDAVIIATPWNWHTPMAVDAMRAKKCAGIEVPAAVTLEECWTLVNTCEETGTPCMMLENWSFRRDNLAVLNMVRQGLFGEVAHCHCAYAHDCVAGWMFDAQGNDRWGAKFIEKKNCDQYPTHSQGPVLSWMDINHGDAYATVSSTATGGWGINAYFRRVFGPDHPNSTRKFAQGDIVTSVVRTHKGKTIVIHYDIQLPRPYDNRWLLQGTMGVYSHEHNALYLEGKSPENHQWEPFAPYQDKYDHPWWKSMDADAAASGHGGTDSLTLGLFISAVREQSPMPVDVYDSATMSSIVGLSELSIAKGGIPVDCPDFTRGAWKTKKPAFGVF